MGDIEDPREASMNEIIVNALIDCVAFFETCDNDTCDPEDAIQQLDKVAHYLGQLNRGQVEELRALINKRLATDGLSPELVTVLGGFMENFGLEDGV